VDAAEEGAAVEVAVAIDYQVTRWQASIVFKPERVEDGALPLVWNF